MIKIFLESFKKTNTSIILAIPLVLLVLIAEVYYSYVKDIIVNIPQMLISIALVITVISAFMASWFYMAKKTLKYANKIFVFETDRGNALKEILNSFPKGFTKLFLAFMGFIMINIAIYYVIHLVISFIITANIADINFQWFDFRLLLSPMELHEKITYLSHGNNLGFSYWLCLMGISSLIISFFTILWIPETVYSKTNVLISLFNSVKKLIITFHKTLLLYIYVQILHISYLLFCIVSMSNIYLYFLAILIYYYLFIYIVVLLYTYYEQTFLR